MAAPKSKGIEKHRRMFENAWWFGGAEVFDDRPFLRRDVAMRYLVEQLDMKESSAKVYLKPSQQGRMIADLLLGEIIQTELDGWSIIDQTQASALMIRKGSK